MTATPIPCSEHRDAAAGWQCTNEACKRHLCGKCTAQLIKLFSCCSCGGHARQVTIPRRARSFAYWLGAALRFPLGAGFALVAAITLLTAALTALPTILDWPADLADPARAARLPLAAIYLLLAIDRAARHTEAGAARRLGRAAAATLVLSVPAAAYVALLGAPARTDWALWLLAVLTLVYLPIALATAFTDTPLAALVNPFKLFEHVFRLGKTYVATLVTALCLIALAVLAASSAPAIQRAIPTPFVGEAAALLPVFAVLAMVGHAIAMLAHVHGDVLGWGTAALFVDPLFPDLVAEGRRKVAPRAASTAIATGDAPEPISSSERADATKLSTALKAEELARALRIYEARAAWSPAALDDRQLVMLAKAATRAKKIPLAQRLLEDACARSGRSAGQALLALAQLHADTLGDTGKARELYTRIVDQFPNSDVARIAALRISDVMARAN
jgi:tetratricopeptide (TPR) repeat protein